MNTKIKILMVSILLGAFFLDRPQVASADSGYCYSLVRTGDMEIRVGDSWDNYQNRVINNGTIDVEYNGTLISDRYIDTLSGSITMMCVTPTFIKGSYIHPDGLVERFIAYGYPPEGVTYTVAGFCKKDNVFVDCIVEPFCFPGACPTPTIIPTSTPIIGNTLVTNSTQAKQTLNSETSGISNEIIRVIGSILPHALLPILTILVIIFTIKIFLKMLSSHKKESGGVDHPYTDKVTDNAWVESSEGIADHMRTKGEKPL